MDSEGTRSKGDTSFWHVFKRAPDVMCIVRVADALILEINDAFEHASGFTRAEILGKSSRDFPWWPNAERREAILDELRTRGELQDVEARFATPHGELIYLISARPLSYGGERCAVWRAADVTEQRRMQEANRALEERLRQKQHLERLGLLAGGIAHDFNNLLVGVLGNAEVLLSASGEDNAQRRHLEAIVTSAHRMADHTRELLDYAGHTALTLAPVRLDALIDEAVALVRPVLDPAVKVQVLQRAEAVWVRGNAGQLTRMWSNLIKNAAEAFKGEPGSVWIEVSTTADHVVVSIRDDGDGMDEATRSRMFEPFFSTKVTGHGLGLASVPGIVERHGGVLSVDSAQGRGTTVRVRIPAYTPPAQTVATKPGLRRWKGRVLVVDDEASVRSVSRALLERLGFEVTEAESGEAALRLVQPDHAWKLVLLDASMPGLDGAQTLERLRVSAPELPVLLCSGYSAADFARLLREPHVAFLTKPFRASQLASVIETLLSGTQGIAESDP